MIDAAPFKALGTVSGGTPKLTHEAESLHDMRGND
jgi:hypothetical protein